MKNKLFFGCLALTVIVAVSRSVTAQQNWIDIGGDAMIGNNYEYFGNGRSGVSFTIMENVASTVPATLKDVTATCDGRRFGVSFTASIDPSGAILSQQECQDNCEVNPTPAMRRAVEFLCR